jgi:hypothetical protein
MKKEFSRRVLRRRIGPGVEEKRPATTTESPRGGTRPAAAPTKASRMLFVVNWKVHCRVCRELCLEMLERREFKLVKGRPTRIGQYQVTKKVIRWGQKKESSLEKAFLAVPSPRLTKDRGSR